MFIFYLKFIVCLYVSVPTIAVYSSVTSCTVLVIYYILVSTMFVMFLCFFFVVICSFTVFAVYLTLFHTDVFNFYLFIYY